MFIVLKVRVSTVRGFKHQQMGLAGCEAIGAEGDIEGQVKIG